MGRAAAALSSAGETAGNLQSKYAPAVLGGIGADAAYDKPSRSGAGVGADSYPGEVQGLNPAKGTPGDAPASEAATGGDAGRIAGIAAGVATGQNEDSAARSMLQVDTLCWRAYCPICCLVHVCSWLQSACIQACSMEACIFPIG